MKFKEMYYMTEGRLEVGDDVHLKDDKTEYVIRNVNDDGTEYELIDKKTKKKIITVGRNDILAVQGDMFGGKSSSDKAKHKKFKRPKKLGKAQDVEQTSLF